MKKTRKVLSILLCMLLCMSMVFPAGITAFAEGEVAYIGDNGYATLAEAVAAAESGDTITLEAKDATSQKIVIDKDLIIELNGNDLTNTQFQVAGGDVVIRDTEGVGQINANAGKGFTASFNRATLPALFMLPMAVCC